jgi:glycosyltransferase involved in cell wall biosynthesis
LIIAAEFPPCGGGGVGRPYAIAKYLAESGWFVHVLTSTGNNYHVENSSYNIDIPNLTITRVYTPSIFKFRYYTRRFLPSFTPYDRFSLWKKIAKSIAIKLHKKHHFDMVFSTYPSVWNHEVALALQNKFPLPWLADFRDPPPWMYIPNARTNKVYEKVFANASAISVTSEKIQTLMLDHVGQRLANKIHVIHNGSDELASTIETTPSDTSTFTIIHTGSFYEDGRDINALIQALKIVDKKGIKLLFVGDTPYDNTLSIIKEHNLENSVTFVDYMPSDEAIKLSATSNALVVIQGEKFENQIPGKVFEYMAMQKPVLIITNKNSATDSVTQANPNTIFADYGNIDAIAQGLNKIRMMEITPIDRSMYSKKKMSLEITKVLETLKR